MNTRYRLWTLALLVMGIAATYVVWRDELTLRALVQHEAQLRLQLAEQPFEVYAVALGAYVAVAALSLPVATALTLLYAWFFGFWPALALVSFASTMGATGAFLLARYLLRDAVVGWFGPRLATMQTALDRDGGFYLFLLRLTPLVPYFVVNVVMGLTTMRARTFWWVSQIGMLPATIVFVSTGASIPSAQALIEQGPAAALRWQTAAALLLLGLFPFAVRYVVKRLKPRTVADATP